MSQKKCEQCGEMVKSGDQVGFTIGREAFACGLALAARKEELEDGIELAYRMAKGRIARELPIIKKALDDITG